MPQKKHGQSILGVRNLYQSPYKRTFQFLGFGHFYGPVAHTLWRSPLLVCWSVCVPDKTLYAIGLFALVNMYNIHIALILFKTQGIKQILTAPRILFFLCFFFILVIYVNVRDLNCFCLQYKCVISWDQGLSAKLCLHHRQMMGKYTDNLIN